MLEFLSQIHFKKIQSWLEERFDLLSGRLQFKRLKTEENCNDFLV